MPVLFQPITEVHLARVKGTMLFSCPCIAMLGEGGEYVYALKKLNGNTFEVLSCRNSVFLPKFDHCNACLKIKQQLHVGVQKSI